MITINIVFTGFVSLLIFVSIIFVLSKDWHDQISRYYALFAFSGLGILFTMFLTYAFSDRIDLTELNKVTQMATLMTFASLFIMSLIFPRAEKKFLFRTASLILAPAFILGLVVVFTDITISRAYLKNGLIVREFRPFYTVYAIITFSYLIAAVINFIRKYIGLTVEIYKLQMRYVFVASSVSILIAAVFSIILPRFFQYSGLYAIGPAIASFFTITALFYSIIAHNLMDITTVIHKTFVYFVTSMLIALPIYAVLEFQKDNIIIPADIPVFLIAAFIVIIFILYSVYVQPQIDRLFKRRQYEFGSVIDRFAREMDKFRELDTIIIKSVDTLVRSLNLERAFCVLINDTTRRYELFYFKGNEKSFQLEPITQNSLLIRWFVRNQGLLLLSTIYMDDSAFADIRDEFTSFYLNNNLEIILPVYHAGMVAGLLCLGKKENLSGYRPDELDKLHDFSNMMNEYISAALMYQKAIKEQLIARTIDLSSTILANTVPQRVPRMESVKFGVFLIPKYEKGVDFFDYLRPGDKGIGVITTDISGVGVKSALYSILLRSSFHASINSAHSPTRLMQNLNRVLFDYSRGQGGLVTAYYLYYDIASKKLLYTAAGYPPLELFRIEKNNFDTLDIEGIPLGYNRDADFGMGKTDLVRGDIGILYSRSLITSKNQKGESFGLLRLRNIIAENRSKRATDIAEQIRRSYEGFMGLLSVESDIFTLVFKIV